MKKENENAALLSMFDELVNEVKKEPPGNTTITKYHSTI